MDALSRQLRIVFRKLLRSPTFTLIALFTLAVGIGANSDIFSVVHGVLLRPLPYPDSERLVGDWHTAPGIGIPRFEHSDATYLLYPRGIAGAGTGFHEQEERPDAEPVVVLGHDLWRSRFGADPGILGRPVRIDGESRTVVGVMPAGFRFPTPETRPWLPLAIDPANVNVGNFNYAGVARLRPEVSTADAAADLTALIARLPEEFADDDITAGMLENARMAALVHPRRDDVVGDVGRVLWILLGSVGFLLLIACANVANLFLVRAEGRAQELAVRTALGASRAQVAGSFLAESTVLSLAGGALGMGLAVLGVRALLALGPDLPRLEEISVDGNVLLFNLAISLVAGLLCGLMPALRGGGDPALALKEGGRSAMAGRGRLRARNLLVVAQIALALVLLAGSGLMVRSFHQLRQVDPGFDPGRILTLRLSLPEAEYATAGQRADFFEQVLAPHPGAPRGRGGGRGEPLAAHRRRLQQRPLDRGFPPRPRRDPADPGHPLGLDRLLRDPPHPARRRPRLRARRPPPGAPAGGGERRPGRALLARRERPRQTSEPRHGGRRGLVHDRRSGRQRARRGAGGRAGGGGLLPAPDAPDPEEEEEEEARSPRSLSLAVRTHAAPTALATTVREAIWSLDRNLPVSNPRTLEEVAAAARARTVFTMLLLAIAAGVALVLGAVGICGVISYLVSRRRQEIGVRMALGADRREVRRMVLRQGLGLAVAGLTVGLAGAFAVTRLLAASLYGVSPTDPLTFAAVSLVLLVIALLASYLPARRAGSVDPLQALRYE